MTKLAELQDVPFVLPDGRGYRLGDEVVEGFADRSDWPLGVRSRIAKLAAAYAPEDLSDVQRVLASTSPKKINVALLQALSDDEALLSAPYMATLLEIVPEDQKRLAATPSSHQKLKGRTYPLKIEDAARLVGVSKRQLQLWDSNRYVRAYRVSGQRRYFRGTVLLAMAVKRLKPYERSVLRSLLRGEATALLSVAAASAVAAGTPTTLLGDFLVTTSLLKEASAGARSVTCIRVAPKHRDEWEVAELDVLPLRAFGTKKEAMEEAHELAKSWGAVGLEVHTKAGQVVTEPAALF